MIPPTLAQKNTKIFKYLSFYRIAWGGGGEVKRGVSVYSTQWVMIGTLVSKLCEYVCKNGVCVFEVEAHGEKVIIIRVRSRDLIGSYEVIS